MDGVGAENTESRFISSARSVLPADARWEPEPEWPDTGR